MREISQNESSDIFIIQTGRKKKKLGSTQNKHMRRKCPILIIHAQKVEEDWVHVKQSMLPWLLITFCCLSNTLRRFLFNLLSSGKDHMISDTHVNFYELIKCSVMLMNLPIYNYFLQKLA